MVSGGLHGVERFFESAVQVGFDAKALRRRVARRNGKGFNDALRFLASWRLCVGLFGVAGFMSHDAFAASIRVQRPISRTAWRRRLLFSTIASRR